MRCPVCNSADLRVWAPERAIGVEIRARGDFVRERLRTTADPSELKDLTEFMHGDPAPLYSCRRCGLLIRGEAAVRAADDYGRDSNDRDLMRQLLPRYVEAFRRKDAYRGWLPGHARVLEIGSHLGAFLQVAEEWNWDASGLDAGGDTAGFARESGFVVHRGIPEEAPFRADSFDAVFVWNCFEQLPDPRAALRSIHRLLKRSGALVVRVPNAWFYGAWRSRRALAYNNLLGFPYLYGHTADTLTRLVSGEGFEPVRGFNSELITMPFADPGERVRKEQRAISDSIERWSAVMATRAGTLTGPWIEIAFRSLEDAAARRAGLQPGAIDARFLKRAA
jgi:SAM-dependent methyltransferase